MGIAFICTRNLYGEPMKRYLPSLPSLQRQQGKWGYILLWALGVPIPVLFLFYLLRGCT